MKYTLKYLSKIIVFSVVISVQAQQKAKTDSILKPLKSQRFGIRVGTDLFKLTRSLYDKNYKGLELVGDYRLTKKYYIAGEVGNENITVQEDYLNFTTKGTYFRVGFDYNLHDNWAGLENMIYVGLRFGVASFSQELNSYKLFNQSNYFGTNTLINIPKQYNGLTAQWGEVVIGLKTKVIDNVFVGFSFRGNLLINNDKPKDFDNLYIPGFNRTYDGSFGVGFNYCVSYLVPLYKKSK